MKSSRDRDLAAKRIDEATGLMPPGKRAKRPCRGVEEVRERDPGGRIVLHHRTIDTLAKMLRAGTISQTMHDSARAFQIDFALAGLDPIRARPMERPSGGGRVPSEFTDRQLDARRRVHEIMQALGGISSPAGSCVWHVVGLQRSVRDWSLRQGWGGRPVRQEQAQGILIAALGILAKHFGHEEPHATGPKRPRIRRPADRSGRAPVAS